MKTDDLFRRLSFGELSNLSLADSGSGTIVADKQPALIHHINDGLLKLYSRFVLKERELHLVQVAHITQYHLRRKFAETSGAKIPYAYIKDLPGDPFTEDVIRILEVHSEGGRHSLNDADDKDSFYTPQPDTLQIPEPLAGRPLLVKYQARHVELDDRPDEIMGQDIEIPFSLECALQYFVGYKVFSNMNGPENIVKGQEYLAAYEAACVDVEQRDLVNQSFHTSHLKLETRGFV